MYKNFEPEVLPATGIGETGISGAPAIPRYLVDTYWWAYVHPRAVRFFDRATAVDLILFGNYRRLRDAAVDALGPVLSGRTLQVACVYGDFTSSLAARLAPRASLDVVDVLPIQLDNLRRKLRPGLPVSVYRRDSADLGFEAGSYDQVVVFFLLHEQPDWVRRQTLAEVLRVVKVGGRVVVVDYHRPHWFNPLRYLMRLPLARLEPFALDLWRSDLQQWMPEDARLQRIDRETFFGGLYQRIVITK